MDKGEQKPEEELRVLKSRVEALERDKAKAAKRATALNLAIGVVYLALEIVRALGKH